MCEIEKRAREEKVDCIELDYWMENEVMKYFTDKHDFVKTRQWAMKVL